MEPDPEARQRVTKDGQRSYASQIFQEAAVNCAYAARPTKVDNWTGLRDKPPIYLQTQPMSRYDTGERVLTWERSSKDYVVDEHQLEPGLSSNEIDWLARRINGEERAMTMESENLARITDGSKVMRFSSAGQMNEQLAQLKHDGKLPVILGVDVGGDPFWQEAGGGITGVMNDPSGLHVVTIHDYDAGPPARVALSNQYGSQSDHLAADKTDWVSVDQLYLATRRIDDPERVKALEIRATNAKSDCEAQLELMRAKAETDMRSAMSTWKDVDQPRDKRDEAWSNYEAVRASLVGDYKDAAVSAIRRWKNEEASGALDPDEKARGMKELQLLYNSFNATERRYVHKQMEKELGSDLPGELQAPPPVDQAKVQRQTERLADNSRTGIDTMLNGQVNYDFTDRYNVELLREDLRVALRSNAYTAEQRAQVSSRIRQIADGVSTRASGYGQAWVLRQMATDFEAGRRP